MASDRADFAESIKVFFLVFLGMLAIRGYGFMRGDMLSLFPSYLGLFDPAAVPADWTLTIAARGGHRLAYAYLVGAPAQLIGWPASSFLLYAATMFLTFLSLVRISERITGQRAVGYIAAALIMIVLDPDTIAKGSFSGTTIPRELARALVLMCIWMWLDRRWMLGGVLLAAATSVHILTGGEAACLVIAAFMIGTVLRGESTREVWRGAGTWVVLSAPAVALLVWSFQVKQSSVVDEALWSHVMGVIRHPHHYVPESWPASRWLLHLVELALVAWAWLAWRPDDDERRRAWHAILWLVPATLSAMLVYLLATTLTWSPTVMKLEVFLNSFWLRIVSGIALATLLVRWSEAASHRPVLLTASFAVCAFVGMEIAHLFLGPTTVAASRALLLVVLWLAASLAGRARGGPGRLESLAPPLGTIVATVVLATLLSQLYPELWGFVASLAGRVTGHSLFSGRDAYCLAVLVALVFVAACRPARSLLKRHLTGLAVVGLAVLATTLVASASERVRRFIGSEHVIRRVDVADPWATGNVPAVLAWAVSNSSFDDEFLTPPMGDEWMLLRTRRPIVFSFRYCPIEYEGTLEWFSRMQAVTRDDTPALKWPRNGWREHREWLHERYDSLDAEQVRTLARRYRASWFVQSQRSPALDLPLAYEDELYRVYEVAETRGPR